MIPLAHKVLFAIGLSVVYIFSCGFPFCYYASLSLRETPTRGVTRARNTSVDVEGAGTRDLQGQIAGWKTIRVTSGVIALGVGLPAFVLYFRSWLLVEKWSEIFLMLSVVFSTTSFSFATVLISSFTEWSGNINELKPHLVAWSILFSIPNISLAWSAMSLVAAAATLVANRIAFSSPIDYFETAIAVLMFIIGLAVTALFYMVHSIWRL